MENYANWGKSTDMVGRLARADKCVISGGEPFFRATYRGQDVFLPIITRDTPVLGRVCLGEGKREAFYLVGDVFRNAIGTLYTEVKKRASEGGRVRRSRLLEAVYQTVDERMKYNETAVERLVRDEDADNDGLVSLGKFMEKGIGVCRHQAATCAALLQLANEDRGLAVAQNNLRGKARMNRNSTRKGGHTWARYTANDGTVVILDVAQHFFGELSDQKTQEKIKRGGIWPYNRPDDSFYYSG